MDTDEKVELTEEQFAFMHGISKAVMDAVLDYIGSNTKQWASDGENHFQPAGVLRYAVYDAVQRGLFAAAGALSGMAANGDLMTRSEALAEIERWAGAYAGNAVEAASQLHTAETLGKRG